MPRNPIYLFVSRYLLGALAMHGTLVLLLLVIVMAALRRQPNRASGAGRRDTPRHGAEPPSRDALDCYVGGGYTSATSLLAPA